MVVIVNASGSLTADAVRGRARPCPACSHAVWSPAPGQRRKEETLPPACRRRPRLPANPDTHRQPTHEALLRRWLGVATEARGGVLAVGRPQVAPPRRNRRHHVAAAGAL